jgi:hypothetical protein
MRELAKATRARDEWPDRPGRAVEAITMHVDVFDTEDVLQWRCTNDGSPGRPRDAPKPRLDRRTWSDVTVRCAAQGTVRCRGASAATELRMLRRRPRAGEPGCTYLHIRCTFCADAYETYETYSGWVPEVPGQFGSPAGPACRKLLDHLLRQRAFCVRTAARVGRAGLTLARSCAWLRQPGSDAALGTDMPWLVGSAGQPLTVPEDPGCRPDYLFGALVARTAPRT